MLPPDVCSLLLRAPRNRAMKKGEEFCLDSQDDEVVPRVEDVLFVDGVLEGALGGKGDEDFAMGKGILMLSSSLVMSTKSCVQGGFLGGMMESFNFLEGLDEEAWVDTMNVLKFEVKEEHDDEE
ncbi:hypothetical protein Tco_0977482 [Tanacetum coccineum]|uniref:Uncharacterized protein n=1 Tax=Tanacetum coccineum TaxID=301880 RepID=A0ABQ5EK78_9ASTR